MSLGMGILSIFRLKGINTDMQFITDRLGILNLPIMLIGYSMSARLNLISMMTILCHPGITL